MGVALDFGAVLGRWPLLLDGMLLTLQLAAEASVLGLIIGTACALGRRGPVRWVAGVVGSYVELTRNTPFLVQVFLVYFGLSGLGLPRHGFSVALAALAINFGACAAEIIRAGLDSVARGQVEAARALALSGLQIYRHVIFPPAIERVWPVLSRRFVALMLASSVCSQISAGELTGAGTFIRFSTDRPFETYFVVAVMYIVLSALLRMAFRVLGQALFERRRPVGAPI